MIHEQASESALAHYAFTSAGAQSLAMAALARLAAGETSLDEVVRAIQR